MVEADYRMKLIGIGLERPPVKMNSWVDLTSASGVAANALQRDIEARHGPAEAQGVATHSRSGMHPAR